MTKPLLALTLGDPAGIGPELILKAFANPAVFEACRALAVGEAALLEQHAQILGMNVELAVIADPREAEGAVAAGRVPVLEPQGERFDGELRLGAIDGRCGAAAHRAIVEAARRALRGEIQGIVTAPIHKEALRASGVLFPGHTELLANLAHVRETAMLMVGGGLRIALATIHIALRDVPAKITRDRLESLFDLTNDFIRRFGVDSPRIAVAGLNPHAGEGGLFGREEIREIRPAIEAAAARGLRIEGPFPGDTVFHAMREGAFDVVVAMYHDQGLAALKTLDFHRGVNVTMGLPFVRTSPDHGTAFDKAGRGVADPSSFLEAVKLAAQLSGGSE
ncbi:MAG: 4-hydroxythreonine-4-phosphate dehydrogenase PdxA [Candidatus Sumerlaeota bacterium]|nr:4-hydroxythreonine-4-phosphate dehydrogenase PdxA [Candidatus Sumerlaeota bacterium]